MKNAIARLIAGYRKLIATPYDVPADHTYSKQSIEQQKLVQDAAAFLANKTGEEVAIFSETQIRGEVS